MSTPRFDASDDDDGDNEDARASKRMRIEEVKLDPKRSIRDPEAFREQGQGALRLTHAAEIANVGTLEKPSTKYDPFFMALAGDEDEAPMIELQYPSACIPERYQLVMAKESDDLRPLDELIDVASTVATDFLHLEESQTAQERIQSLIRIMKKSRSEGLKRMVGSQSNFIRAVSEYNSFITKLRNDSVIAQNLDALHSLRLSLVERILTQIYARTVSPHINSLKAYENGTDNVYGELLPRFLSNIFQKTELKSDHIFVDLGSGVGNVVLQAALETGCEAWGCEMMPNACDVADLQAQEFPSRCKIWGLKPGTVHLERGDFMSNQPTIETLKRADVVLINNQAFTPELNDTLKNHFFDLKEGCQIVSLKSFVPKDHKLQERNYADIINRLVVQEFEYFSDCVSWGAHYGKWYLQKKDSSKLNAFIKAHGL